MPTTKLLTVAEYAALTGKAPSYIQTLLRRGRFPDARKVKGSWRIPADASPTIKQRGRKKKTDLSARASSLRSGRGAARVFEGVVDSSVAFRDARGLLAVGTLSSGQNQPINVLVAIDGSTPRKKAEEIGGDWLASGEGDRSACWPIVAWREA